jgi:hypothetical protein
MSLNFAQILQDDFITPMVRKTAYGLATTCVLGAAVYAGYRVAAPEKHLIKQHRHPELNDQVREYESNVSTCLMPCKTKEVEEEEENKRKGKS